GFRLVNSVSTAPLANRLDVFFNFNDVNTNSSRGMNVLNMGNAWTSLSASGNTIDSNENEGVYIVNTASLTQGANFGALLASDGLVTAIPRLELNFQNNDVTNNG